MQVYYETEEVEVAASMYGCTIAQTVLKANDSTALP